MLMLCYAMLCLLGRGVPKKGGVPEIPKFLEFVVERVVASTAHFGASGSGGSAHSDAKLLSVMSQTESGEKII